MRIIFALLAATLLNIAHASTPLTNWQQETDLGKLAAQLALLKQRQPQDAATLALQEAIGYRLAWGRHLQALHQSPPALPGKPIALRACLQRGEYRWKPGQRWQLQAWRDLTPPTTLYSGKLDRNGCAHWRQVSGEVWQRLAGGDQMTLRVRGRAWPLQVGDGTALHIPVDAEPVPN